MVNAFSNILTYPPQTFKYHRDEVEAELTYWRRLQTAPSATGEVRRQRIESYLYWLRVAIAGDHAGWPLG